VNVEGTNETEASSYPDAWKYRVLVGTAIASPVVVGGGAAVLVAHTLAHSWLWGMVGLISVLVLFALVTVALIRRSRRNPEAVQAYMAAFGRAQAGFPLRAFPWMEGDAAKSDERKP
jgi:hypothetical protein